MKNASSKYVKTDFKGRKTKVSSVNIETYQSKMLDEQGINLSKLTRDLLELYLTKNFPERYKQLKELENPPALTVIPNHKEEDAL